MQGLQYLLVAVYQAIAILAIVHVVMDNRQPAKTMAWAMVIYFVPVVGIILYIFFGINKRKERVISQRSLDQLSKRSMLKYDEQTNLQLPERHKPLIDLFIRQNFTLPFRFSRVDILSDGHQFVTTLLADIARAKEHIHIDMYIFEDDELGLLVSDALISKSRQGVEVRVIYDDVGCWNVKHRFFERMREEGIDVSPFLPVRFPSVTSSVNYRNHRKIVIIDGFIGYVGGMNIAKRYVKGLGKLRWRDTMLRIEGMGVYSLQRAFLIDWYFVDRTLLSDRKYYPAMDAATEPAGSGLMQTVVSGPTAAYPEIMQGFVRIIHNARKYIYMETPYFLPTEPVLFAMKTAAAAGIDVRLLVPKENDATLTEWASRSYLREADAAGIKVMLYTGGFLHSKMLVSDDCISTCGSSNVDFRSFENNFEVNVFFYDEDLALCMKQLFLEDERQAVNLKEVRERYNPRFPARLGESIVRLLSPLM